MSDYRALYRKWRPVDFDDVSGQNAITDILKYEVANNKLSHAYLFCGSRGTGKTSCAKILAKAVNCLNPRNGNPCNECVACRSIDAGTSTDVIEMDAASNNGVDNVRDMKDEINFTPAELKYRVYIIDEVHMMTTSAFNALLKTLEEPPSYVIFILATTEFHKLPTTIVSRCQRFDFKRISSADIVSRLMHIANGEGITVSEDAARVIARVSRGGMRDAVSLLELCAGAGNDIDASTVFEAVGSGNRESTYRIIKAILDKDYDTLYSTVDDIVMTSGDLSVFWQELIDSYRDIMVVKNSDRARSYLDLTELEYKTLSDLSERFSPTMLAYHVSIMESAMADMQRAFNSKRSIAEIALSRMCEARSAVSLEALALRVEELERELARVKLEGVAIPSGAECVTASPITKTDKAPDPIKSKTDKTTDDSANAAMPRQYAAWGAVLSRMSEVSHSISAKFLNSKAYIKADGTYLICMNSVFANNVASSERDLSLLRGTISELESVPANSVKLAIEPISTNSSTNLGDEMISLIDN